MCGATLPTYHSNVTSLTAELVARLGAGRVIAHPAELAGYGRDRGALAAAGLPEVVVRARSTDDVVATLRVATAHRAPVVTRGAGTGLAGGANALPGCIVLSTIDMGEILGVDVGQRTATAQAGVITAALQAAVAEHGLWYPPDPASRAISTIGGNIATNAGGGCCLKYGVTGDHVAALTAVLADGTVIRTGAITRENVAGLDLTRLLVGSEGVLAVMVEATVRLRRAPAPPATLAAAFRSPHDAGVAVLALQRVAELSLLELMDRTTIGAVEQLTGMGLDTTAGAMLIVQSDVTAPEADIALCAAACRAAGASAVTHTSDPAEGEALLDARRSALPALERLGVALLDDVVVPVAAIPAMLTTIEQIAERNHIVIGAFGHAGDGNLHPTIVLDPAAPGSEASARQAFNEILAAAIALGGTITGEHGVGLLKRPHLDAVVGGAERALMARLKAAFDPDGILNPGKAI